MQDISLSVRTNSTFDLKSLVKMHYTQQQLAKKLKMSREQINNILNNPRLISVPLLETILELCGYKLELKIIKIEENRL